MSIDKLNYPSRIDSHYKQGPDLLEKVTEYMRMCESEQDSYYHWNYLKALYNRLSKNPELEQKHGEVFDQLKTFMAKHRQFDSDDYLDRTTGEY